GDEPNGHHNNARLTPRGREDMVRAVVDRGLSKAEAARQFNASWKTVDKWVNRFRTLGGEGLRDRSSRPHSMPSQTPLATADAVEARRRDRQTQDHIAAYLGLSTATVSRICKARGLSKLDAIEPKDPRPRYERGEIVHIDIKKLGRFNKPGHRVTGHVPGHPPQRRRRPRVRPRRHRRSFPRRTHRYPSRREEGKRHHLPATYRRLLR